MKNFLIPDNNKNSNKIDESQSKFGFVRDRKFYGLVLFIYFVIGSLAYTYIMIETTEVSYILKIDTEHILHVINEKFLSVALDSSIIRKRWRNLDLNSPVLIALVSALSPAYFRLGGTASDCLIFNSHPTRENVENLPLDGGLCVFDSMGCDSYHQNFTMSTTDWLEINRFTKSSGLDLLFDLNVLLRNGEVWDPTNAIELIKFSQKNGLMLSWQLGNEPNSFKYVFNRNVSGTQLAKDFIVLRSILDEIYEKKNVVLVGPDVTRPRPPGFNSISYLKDFIEEIKAKGNGVINAITWHHYYLSGREAKLEDYINPSNFKIFVQQLQMVVNTILQTSPELPIWLTETSDAYGGGAPNITDRFVGGFMWLDKLGLAAAHGLQIVARQSIFGGYYSLIDEELKPLPDFWLSVLHKKLVGSKVLRAQLGIEKKNRRNSMMQNVDTLHFYCHCAPSWSNRNERAITIFGLNIGQEAQSIKVKGVEKAEYRDTYVLTGEDGLQSRFTLLNGIRLEMEKDGELPAFRPIKEDKLSPITLPPYSMGFWVYHGIITSICD